MIMKTKDLTIELRPTTRKIINLTDKFKEHNLSELFFKCANKTDIKAMAEIVFAFGECDGKSPFNNDMNRVYDFIDNYKNENSKSYEDIYNEFSEVLNSEGFFSKKMTKKELDEAMDNPMSSIDMEQAMKTVMDKVATEMATKEFNGYKA